MITETMYIGSGDIASLMAGIGTKAYSSLLQRFVSGEKPHYNALASPIDACRAGAILELRYLDALSFEYFPQYVVVSKEMDVLKASIDFAKVVNDAIVDFDELKTISLDDFFTIGGADDRLQFVKSKYKKYYNQIQEQLYCSELESCNLVFLAVYSYDDADNYSRVIEPTDYFKIRIPRDQERIEQIKKRAEIFQTIKNYYHANLIGKP